MFRFFEKMFIRLLSVFTIGSFSESLVPNSIIRCVSFNNQPCQTRPTLVNINSDETLFYSFTLSVNKCGGVYNTIYDLYTRVK